MDELGDPISASKPDLAFSVRERGNAQTSPHSLLSPPRQLRDIEMTSYGEIVLTGPKADRAHPAFEKLFIETEWVAACSTLLASRRPREATDAPVPWRRRARTIGAAVDREAWDGAWYRRAFFDDGAPLGSAKSDECQIDAIAQSWSVISGAGDPERARRAMQSVNERPVDGEASVIKLLAPPFDRLTHDPRSWSLRAAVFTPGSGDGVEPAGDCSTLTATGHSWPKAMS